VNLSCPNTHAGRAMFAHDVRATEDVIAATSGCNRPRWAKLSPNVTELAPIVDAARRGGAEAVTLINTLMGMAIDPATRKYRLGSGRAGGGVSGPGIHAVAVRAIHDVHAAFPDVPIVGVGGVSSGEDAAELLVAGANAVQVGTATFADPRAPVRVLEGLERWLAAQPETRVRDVIGAVHD